MKRLIAPTLLCLAAAGLFFLFSAPNDATAQDRNSSFGNRATDGIDAWKSGGVKSAVRRWTQTSPLGKDEAFLRGLESDLSAVEDAYGKPRSYQTIHTIDLTNHIRLLYVGVHLEKGPLFMRFLTYKKNIGSERIVSEIDYNLNIDPLLTPLLSQGGL